MRCWVIKSFLCLIDSEFIEGNLLSFKTKWQAMLDVDRNRENTRISKLVNHWVFSLRMDKVNIFLKIQIIFSSFLFKGRSLNLYYLWGESKNTKEKQGLKSYSSCALGFSLAHCNSSQNVWLINEWMVKCVDGWIDGWVNE